jgi:tetratricopeptide (TPR) repeat protein
MHSSVNIRILVLCVLVLALTLPAGAQQSGTGARVQAVYEALRDAVYDYEPLSRQKERYREALGELAASSLPAADLGLWRSRIEYLAGRGFQAREEKQDAIGHYEAGLAALEVFAAKEKPSEAWRMTSECISQLCLLKNVAWVVANGPKVMSYAEKAIALDPRNAAARIIVAASKVYPPPVFGGNPGRGIELMREALALGTAEKDDLFNIYSGIGIAYSKMDDKAAARPWMDKALALYPGNEYIRQELSRLSD